MSDTMIDRESVIRQLTQHMARADYIETDWMDCVSVPMLRDALALLREQEPRVLTYEEADAIAHQTEETAIYLERKSHKSLYAAIAGDTQGRVPNISWLGKERNYQDEYGKTWRCWSARPTDEQREAVPWNT